MMENEENKQYKISLHEWHCIKVKGLSPEQINNVIKRFYYAGCENNLHISAITSCKTKDSTPDYYVWSYSGLIMGDAKFIRCTHAIELSYEQLMS